MARIPLIGQSYATRSLAASAQTCVNLIPELHEDANERAKGIGFLMGAPGKTLLKTLTTIDASATPLRGLWTGGGRLFVFAGDHYFELNSSFALVGSVRTIANTSGNPVQAFGNANQLLIVSDGIVYIDNGSGPQVIDLAASAGTVDTNGTLVTWVSGDKFVTGTSWVGKTITIDGVDYVIDTVSAEDQLYILTSAGTQSAATYSLFGEGLTGITGAYLDGYFLVNRPHGGTPDLGRQINFSAILDGTDWRGLDMFIKEGYPDYVRSIMAHDEQLYVFGWESLQVYQNTGDATTPFQPIPGTMQKYGSISPWGPISLDGHVYFVGGNKGNLAAYVLDGYTPRKISTFAVESQWRAAGLGERCVSYGYQEEGHTIWVINMTDQVWAFDTSTGAWHERRKWTGSAWGLYQTHFHTFVEWPNGTRQHITGSSFNANIYESSVNIYNDESNDIKWERAVPYIFNKGKRIFYGRAMLECETGTVASGAEPTISMDYSDDRGRTFSTPITAGIGVHDDFSKQVFWQPTGSSFGRVMRFSGVGKSKVSLIDLNIETTEGDV